MVEKTKIITLERLTEYDNLIKEHIDNKIPTKTSELTNDSGFATENYVLAEIAKAQLEGEDIDLSGFAMKDDIIKKASDLEDYASLVTENELNSKGYLTEHQSLVGYAKTTDLDTKVDKVSGKGLSSNDYTTEEKNKLTSFFFARLALSL